MDDQAGHAQAPHQAAGFEVKKEFVLNGQRYYYTNYNNPGQPIEEKIGVYVQFRNSQQNKLGMPLPAGTIRLYKKDDKGNQQFIGEDKIDPLQRSRDRRRDGVLAEGVSIGTGGNDFEAPRQTVPGRAKPDMAQE